MNDLLKKELEEELEDLKLFADPFEEFTGHLHNDGSWGAHLVRRGKEMMVVRRSNGTIRQKNLASRDEGDIEHLNFKGLLVSESFANLDRLAGAQRYFTRNLIDPETGKLKKFLPVSGEVELSNRPGSSVGFNEIHDMSFLENQSCVLIIDGSAGVGKSYMLERIVRSRAHPKSYKGEGKPLLLHVESRGKVLMSLNDRIAGTLSSLRASFFEEELKPLIRRGVIQLAIDGFDELSDSRGYIRAWGALREFIGDLKGKGTCVLAGRDTMLDRATVDYGLKTVVDPENIVFLRIQHPSTKEVVKWLSGHKEWNKKYAILRHLGEQFESSEYLRRPFFASRIADLGPDRVEDTHGDPIADLIEGIVQREGERLASVPADITIELAVDLYGEVLSEVARMMMDDETNEIEIDLVELLLIEVFGDYANPEMVSALAQRAKALALLEEGRENSDKRTFPHETVRSYFFARNIFDYFPKHGATTGLYRVPLSDDDFRIFNRVARRKHESDQRQLREKLLEKLREPGGYDYLRSNIGGLLLSFAPLKEDDDEDDVLVLSHLELREIWMADLLGTQKVSLNHCRIHRLDVRGADLGEVSFLNTEVDELLADSLVMFGTSAPDITRCIIIHEHFGKQKRIFKDDISEWIKQGSRVLEKNDADLNERWFLLQKFARISMRQYWIPTNSHLPVLRSVFLSPLWPDLRQLLERHKRLKSDATRHASGPREWLHLVAAEEFLKPGEAQQETTRLILEELNVSLQVTG